MQADQLSAARIYPLGDAAIVMQFGEHISQEVHQRVRAFASYLEKHPVPGLIEQVPAFTTVTVYYDPWLLSEKGKRDPYQKVVDLLLEMLSKVGGSKEETSRIVEVPVCYGGDFGPDLAFVARHNHLSEEEVIAMHTAGDYLVYMIGFAPGFPYLGGMNEQIATPRKSSPRARIPQGSVGIAGKQTGIYSIETPGGWQLIGRTPLLLFDPYRSKPSLLYTGDRVRFVPISKDEYEWRKEQSNGA